MLSYNEQTGETEIKTVTQTFTSSHTELVKITHSGGQTITSSLGHRYFTQRGWIGAEDLRAGDILQLVNGETVIVEQVQHELLENSETLYNFSVDGNHNYYVAESVESNVNDFVLVHNYCKQQIVAGNRNGYNAKVSVGGEQIHKLPHAHIFWKHIKLASVDSMGNVLIGHLDSKGLAFVKKNLELIAKGIAEFYN